jgi:hypothetical protein
MPEIIYPESVAHIKPAVNLKQGEEKFFLNAWNRKIPAVDLLRLKNILVLNNSLFNPWRMRFYPGYTHWWKPTLKTNLFHLSLLKRKAKKLGKGIWVTNMWGEGYFHWLTDVIPRIMVAEKYIQDHLVILPKSHYGFKYITATLELLDVPYMFYEQHIPLLVKDILVPGFTGPTGNYSRDLIRQVRERFTSHLSDRTAQRKIYISRRHAPHAKDYKRKGNGIHT